MFSTRANQENLVHAHQAAAASKPLNQGIRGLEAKTPNPKAPKTPFRAARQDENNFIRQSGFRADKSKHDVFVTPAAAQARAPLGIKTTNVKTRPLQTPGIKNAGPNNNLPSAQKAPSPRLRRARVKIHQSIQELEDADHEEPDIEFMPPRSIPLPDYPEGYDSDDERIKPMVEQMTKELQEEKVQQAADAVIKARAAAEKSRKALHAQQDAEIMQALTKDFSRRTPMPRDTTDCLNPSKSRQPGTAAAALAKHIYRDQPAFARPTAATKARSHAVQAVPNPHDNKTLKASTYSTLGYAKGRVVSASARNRLPSQAHQAGVLRRSRPAIANGQDDTSADFKQAGLSRIDGLDVEPEPDRNASDGLNDNDDGLMDSIMDELVFDNFQLDVPTYDC